MPTHATHQRFIRKILITLAGGSVAFVVAKLVDDSALAFQVAFAVFVGGVLFVLLYLVEVDQRLAGVEISQEVHASATRELMQGGFLKINEATELYGKIETSALRKDTMTQLVRHSISIDANASPLVLSFAKGEIARLSRLLKELANGSEVPYDGEDRDWMLGLTRSASNSIDAISLTTVDEGVDGGLWMTDLGQRYLQAQQEALHRGVRIRRIFVTDGPSLNGAGDGDFRRICDMQTRMGIEIRLLNVADAPGTRANTMFDFIIFDGSISYESTPASLAPARPRQPIIINTRLVQDEERLRDRTLRFSELWSVATLVSRRDPGVGEEHMADAVEDT